MENTDLSFYIHKLSNHTDRISHAIYNRKELNECSLTSLFVLDFLYAHRDQRLCQRDIEDEFFINRATASKMLRHSNRRVRHGAGPSAARGHAVGLPSGSDLHSAAVFAERWL